jgi:hypothetical protein
MFRRDDCERRERQRQMKNDEAQPSPEAAREEFFRAVEPEARRNMLAIRRATESGLKTRNYVPYAGRAT